MTKSKAFQEWWKDAEVRGRIFTVGFQEYAAIVWDTAWTSATLGQLDRAKEEAGASLRANLMELAVQAFREKDTARAEFYRDVADEKHIIWSK